MSFGLAFAQGLVGGFRKNIAREDQKRATDDERYASLQQILFDATVQAEKDGKPVPKTMGNRLQEAKTAMDASRKANPIGLLGTGVADRLDVDMTDLSGIINGVASGNYFQLGGLRIPMNPLYEKEKNLGNRAFHFLQGINKYASVPEQLKLMKKELENSSVAKYFNGELVTQKGLYKALIGKDATPSGATKIVSVPIVGTAKGQFPALGNFDNLKEVDIDDTEQDINTARDKMFGKEGTGGTFNKNRKSHLVLPFKTTDGKNDFFKFELNPKDMQALRRIAELNGEKDPSVFISKFRKSIGRTTPTLEDKFVDDEEIRKFFPSVFHSIELEKLGASLNLTEIKPEEKQKILGYLNTKVGLNIGDRVRALAPLMKLEKNQQISLIQSIEGFSSQTGGDLDEKDKFFFDAVGLKQAEFDEKYLATEDTVNGLKQLMDVEGNLNTTPGGVVRAVKQFFGSLVATTGVIEQVSNIFSGSKKDDVTQESLLEIVKRVKGEGGIETDLARMSQSESIMIALAANMARAVDPSGRLSNQDFEVQLRRLGASGFFRTKVASVSQLENVMRDFNGRLERIEMIKKVRDDAKTRKFTKREFQILNANAKLDNLMKGLQAGSTSGSGSSEIVYDESLTFDSNKHVGPNGELVVKKRNPSDGKYHFFINGKRVKEDQLIEKNKFTPPASDNKINNKTNQNKKEIENKVSTGSVKGSYVSGNNVSGMILNGPDGNRLPGLYIQRNGKFIQKPENSEGI